MSPIKPLALALALLLYSVRCHSAVIIAGYSLPLPTILSSGGELIAGPSLSPDAPTTYVTLKARSPAVTTPSADTMALETLEPAPEHLEDDVVPPKYRCRRCFKPIGPVPVPVRVPEAPEIIHFVSSDCSDNLDGN